MGFNNAANYAIEYHKMVAGFAPDQATVEELHAQGAEALPVITFVHSEIDGDALAMENAASPHLERAEQLIGWISGDYLNEFAYFTAATTGYCFRLVPPQSHRRLLLGPGNVGEALAQNIKNIGSLADADERFAFALSLYRDALHEKNLHFKIARLFSVLESLSYALKKGNGSRSAIRTMLRLEHGAVGEGSYAGRKIRYERIELAGRLRDKLFHGVPFERKELSEEWRESFDLLSERPEVIASDLMADCELEFARWGNNASVARAAAEERRQRKEE
jgi:hypothetical protein